MRILFLTARLPYPPTRGDRVRVYHFLRELSREHQIVLLSFIADDAETANLAHLRPFCNEIHLIHHAPWQSVLSVGLNIWRPLPLQALYYRSSLMQQAVDRLLGSQHFDAVYVHLFRMAQYLDKRKTPFRILDLTDAISHEIALSLPFRSLFWRQIYQFELPRIQRYEQTIPQAFDEVWLISEADRQALMPAGASSHVVVVPMGVDIERYRPAARGSATSTLVFVGAMSVHHNIDAARHLVNDILPLIRNQVPDVTVQIIGDNPVPSVLQLAAVPGVTVPGFVTDLNAALNQATVFVAPLRFAAGIQTKVLEAMAAGLPVVTTSQVNRGLEATDGEHLFVADDPETMAAAVVNLLNDPERRTDIGRAGRTYVMENFRWEAVLDQMRTLKTTRREQ